MKIKCINEGGYENLSLGKEYELLHDGRVFDYVEIVNDANFKCEYEPYLFEVVGKIEKPLLELFKNKKEMINHPKHYNMGNIEVVDVIEDWNLGFCLGNAIKYIGRADHQGNKMQDLKKALWFLEREINSLEKGQMNA